MKLEFTGMTDVGKRRLNNEDNFFADGYYKKSAETLTDKYCSEGEKDNFLFSVCDGMGGTKHGEHAAMEAVRMLSQYSGQDFSKCLNDYIKRANDAICAYRTQHNTSAGTTLTTLFFKSNTVYAANIGDSRIYRYRDGALKQLSADHTEAQGMVDEGVITAEHAKNTAAFHILTQHLGLYEEDMELEPFVFSDSVNKDDIYLLCSDGLTDMLDDGEIKDAAARRTGTEDICGELIERALKAGGKDNVTVIVIRVLDAKSDLPNRKKKKHPLNAVITVLCLLLAAWLAIVCYSYSCKINELEYRIEQLNSQIEELNSQIEELNSQTEELNSQTEELGTQDDAPYDAPLEENAENLGQDEMIW